MIEGPPPQLPDPTLSTFSTSSDDNFGSLTFELHSTRQPLTTNKAMLRRKPTAITLTSEDVAAYEDSIAQRNQNRSQENNSSSSAAAAAAGAATTRQSPWGTEGTKVDPNDELKPLPGDRARVARGVTSTGAAGQSSAAERAARIMGR